jgi:predicted 2-oxoglutarate/Fe(II)-dependent dioxygenase YbiX
MPLKINGLFPGELTPSTTIAGCIDIFENAWPNPKQAIELVEKECANPDSGAYWTRAETLGNGPHQASRTNKLLPVSALADVSNNSVLQNIHNQFYTTLLASTNPYARRYGIEEEFYHEGYDLLKYTDGQEYKKHYDGGTKIGRAISAVMYLNDDYQGGEIEFPRFDLKIKPGENMAIMFPANYVYNHIVHPVLEGTRYTVVNWFE